MAENIIKKEYVYDSEKNIYFSRPKDNPKDLIEVEIGDAKQKEFYPQVKMMRWDNEANFSMRYIGGDKIYHEDHEKNNEVISSFRKDRSSERADFYPVDNVPEGGIEFDIIIQEAPKTNVLKFSINHKNIEFAYQDPISLEEDRKKGSTIEENVISSYALYSKENLINIKGGKEYKCGKVGHIYRPEIFDANGVSCWGDIKIDEKEEFLDLTIPQEFLDKAVYPVRIDPTIGYTSVGGTNVSTLFDSIFFSRTNTLTTSAGIVSSISLYAKNEKPYRVGIYDNAMSAGNRISNTYSGTSTANAWTTVDASAESLSFSDATNYYPAFGNDQDNLCTIARDANQTANGAYIWYGFGTLPTAHDGATNIPERFSIYVTYEADTPSESSSISSSLSPSSSISSSPSSSESPSSSISLSPSESISSSPSESISSSVSSSISGSESPSSSISDSLSSSISSSISSSVSPSTSISSSLSSSPSSSLSSSVSSSISPSSSVSSSRSSSISSSVSPSTSISSSSSSSISSSVSPSSSVSSSVSLSLSSSISGSISPGYENYTKGDYAVLPADDADLENEFTTQEVANVEANDDVYTTQTGTNQYIIHQFKKYVGALNSVTLNWYGRVSQAPTTSPVYFQIYNRNTSEWETIDSDTTTDSNTKSQLTGTVGDLTNYKDVNTVVSCRVYQLVI